MTRQEVQGMSPFTSSAGRAKLLAKNRQTFILQTTKLTRIARRVCQDILQSRRAARRPYASINSNAVKAECEQTLIYLFFIIIFIGFISRFSLTAFFLF